MQKYNFKDIRFFGLAFTIILSLLALKLFRAGNLFYKNLRIIAAIFLFSAVFVPKGILPIYRVFRLIGTIIGWLVSKIILISIFYLVFTPIGLFLRLIGKDLLNLKKIDVESYWIKNHEVLPKDRYSKQF